MKTPSKVIEPENEGNGFGVTEMKDMSTKQKMLDNMDIVQGNILQEDDDSTDLNHSFDEGDIIGTSPVKAREDMPSIKTKISLSWHDIDIQAEPRKGCCGKKGVGEVKQILKGISGSALPGQFISIIGASGAGKTTLLNHLSGRLISNNLLKSGQIKINGVDSTEVKGFSAFSAYVQ